MTIQSSSKTALLLRLGLATVFTYAAVSSFVAPNEWVGYFPQFLQDMVSVDILLPVFSVYEIALAIWLLSGLYARYAALLSAATLAGIVVSNFSLFAITFRDIALIFASLALFVEDSRKVVPVQKNKTPHP